MAGNGRNLDIQWPLTYNLFVILCPAGGAGSDGCFYPNKIEDLQFSTEKQIMDRNSARIKAVEIDAKGQSNHILRMQIFPNNKVVAN